MAVYLPCGIKTILLCKVASSLKYNKPINHLIICFIDQLTITFTLNHAHKSCCKKGLKKF